MIKYKTFYTNVNYDNNKIDHDKKVSDFINLMLFEGHTFLSTNACPYGVNNSHIRTEIIFIENQTRRVIVEKQNKNA
jgi:hypothetical protein